MRVKGLFEITTKEMRRQGGEYSYVVVNEIEFENKDFEKMAISLAVNYKKQFLSVDRTFPRLFSKSKGKYFMSFMELDKLADTNQRRENLSEFTGEYEVLDTMLDFLITGKYRLQFKQEDMAQEAVTKSAKLLVQELKEFSRDAYFRYGFK
ncbi:hypothetical protein ACM26V_18745 [Salipaludibacillus sp. HK11]|uniref:hypothetical protein n=1 Tax=Salipaludibacillus sp. HK11 TaxID=3394320 RepID=UPI0039FC006A